MAESTWRNPWKLTAVGMALVAVTAVVTGLVVANRSGDPKPVATSSAPVAPAAKQPPAVPTQAAINACNQSAASQVGERNKTTEVVKDGAIGAVAGAAVGAAVGAIADGGSGAGKGAAIGGIVGAGGGSLYGLNENQKHDQCYRDAYASYMRGRGYTG
jgi:hypothetical protein